MKLSKLYITAIILPLLLAIQPVNASTSYKTLEIYDDIHVFEYYLDSLSANPEFRAHVQNIGPSDHYWQVALKKNRNTISSVSYHENGSISVKNERFKFEIIFSPNYLDKEVKWTCKIKDETKVFHPKKCNSWLKVIFLKG